MKFLKNLWETVREGFVSEKEAEDFEKYEKHIKKKKKDLKEKGFSKEKYPKFGGKER